MHSFFYKALTAALELPFPVYTSNHTGEMALPCVIVSAEFSASSTVSRNWTFDASAEFRLCMPAENPAGADATQVALDDAENVLITALHMLQPDSLNSASGDNSPLYFYSGLNADTISDWELSDMFPEPSLQMSITGQIVLQR